MVLVIYQFHNIKKQCMCIKQYKITMKETKIYLQTALGDATTNQLQSYISSTTWKRDKHLLKEISILDLPVEIMTWQLKCMT